MGIRKLLVIALLVGPATTWGEVLQKLDNRITEGVACEAQESAEVVELMKSQLVAKKFLEWGIQLPADVDMEALNELMTVEVEVLDCLQITVTQLEEPQNANASARWYEIAANLKFLIEDETQEGFFLGSVSLEEMEMIFQAIFLTASPIPGEPGMQPSWPEGGDHPWPEMPNPRQPKKGEYFNI